MALVVTDISVTPFVDIVFQVKDGTNSPYQGHLRYDPTVYAGMTPDQVQADQLAQYATWKANLAAMQAAAAAAASQVPAQVTSVQARRAIDAAGLKATVEAAVAQADQATQDMWYTAATIDRSNPQLNALATTLWGAQAGATLDQLFTSAGQMSPN